MVYSNYVICRWSAIWNRAFSFQANATHEFSQWVFKIQSQCYIISLDIHMLYVCTLKLCFILTQFFCIGNNNAIRMM